MKKLLLFVLAVMGFAACTNDSVEEQVAVQHDAPETLTVGFEDDGTRIQLNEAQKTVWTRGDLVSVFYKSDGNDCWQFTGNTGDRSGSLRRVSVGDYSRRGDYAIVVYPYNPDYLISLASNTIEASLPAVQEYTAGSYGVGSSPMVAMGDYKQFSLKSVCGWLKLQLTGGGQYVRSITLRGNNGEQVAGDILIVAEDASVVLAEASVDVNDDEVGGTLLGDGDVLREVTLECINGAMIGSEVTEFYIALPPQTFENGLSIDVECDDSEPFNISTSNKITIERNHIQPMAVVDIPNSWVSIGTGMYFDDCLAELVSDGHGLSANVEFEQHKIETNRYRVVNPFGAETISALWGGVPTWLTFGGQTYIEFDVTDPNNVKIGPQNYVKSVTFAGGNGYSYDMKIRVQTDYDLFMVWKEEHPITFQNGMIKFPTEGMALILSEYGELEQGFLVNTKGLMRYCLPGHYLDITAEYVGMNISADNSTASAILNFGYGDDVESFKFAIADGRITDTSAIVEAIVAGSDEYAIFEGNANTNEYIVPVVGSGHKTLVAIPYAEGEAMTGFAAVCTFFFPGLGGEYPEVEINIAVDSVVGITGNPDYEASYPSDSTMCIYIEANADELESITAYVGVDVPTDVANEDILASGEDFSGFISDMKEYGYALAVYTGLTPGTTYDVVLGFETVYGKYQTYRTAYTPKAATSEQ